MISKKRTRTVSFEPRAGRVSISSALFGTSSAFRGWVRVRVLGYDFVLRGRKVKSRDCALASDLVKAQAHAEAFGLVCPDQGPRALREAAARAACVST